MLAVRLIYEDGLSEVKEVVVRPSGLFSILDISERTKQPFLASFENDLGKSFVPTNLIFAPRNDFVEISQHSFPVYRSTTFNREKIVEIYVFEKHGKNNDH